MAAVGGGAPDPTVTAGRRRPSWLHRPRTLRSRLLVAIAGLMALTIAVIALATTLMLRSYLIGQVDDELDGSLARAAQYYRGGAPNGPADQQPPGLAEPGQGPGTVVAAIIGNTAYVRYLDDFGSPKKVSTEDAVQLAGVPADRGPVTLSLDDIGDYRVEAMETSQGKLVVGLPLDRTERAIGRLVAVEIAVAAVGLALAVFASWEIVGRSLRPLRRVAATATSVSRQPLSKGEVAEMQRVEDRDADPTTEVGQVGSAFNQMIGHVERSLEARQASETRVRTFVADASHELRTPLAAIRGYAELTRRSQQEVPADIAHALSRVESESARMTVLVEDLLLLARLDSGRPLDTDPVDLAELIVDTVSDAHAAAPDHHWSLDLPEESLVVAGDRARLHQVVANLLANARTHTPPGTEVRVSLARSADGRRAVLEVHDDGPGVPADLQPAIFERFARGDSSRARTTGSTGLGLAIVAAVCAAHHGQVSVDSVAGSTTFTVELPLDSTLTDLADTATR